MAEKTRYTDEELEEFRVIIEEKLALVKRDYDQMMSALMNKDSRVVLHSRKKRLSRWLPVSRNSFRV